MGRVLSAASSLLACHVQLRDRVQAATWIASGKALGMDHLLYSKQAIIWRSPCKLVAYKSTVPGAHRPAVQAHAAIEVHVTASTHVLLAVAALETAASGTGMPGELVEVAAALRSIVAPLLAVQPVRDAARYPAQAAPQPARASLPPAASADLWSADALALPAAAPLEGAEPAVEWGGAGADSAGRLVRASLAAESWPSLELLEGLVGRGAGRPAIDSQRPGGEPEASCGMRASSSLETGAQSRWAGPEPAAGSFMGLAPDPADVALPSGACVPLRCQSPSLPHAGSDADRPADAGRRSALRRAAAGKDNADMGVEDLMGVRRLSTGESSAIGAGSPRRAALGALVRTGASGCSWGSGGAESLGMAESPVAAPAAGAGSPISMRGAGSAAASAHSSADAFLGGLAMAADSGPAAGEAAGGQTQGVPPAQDLADARRAWAALMVRLSLRAHEQLPPGALVRVSAAWATSHTVVAAARAQHALTAENVDAAVAAAGCSPASGGLLKDVSALLLQARLAEDFPGCVRRCLSLHPGVPTLSERSATEVHICPQTKQEGNLHESTEASQGMLTTQP